MRPFCQLFFFVIVWLMKQGMIFLNEMKDCNSRKVSMYFIDRCIRWSAIFPPRNLKTAFEICGAIISRQSGGVV